MEAVGEDLERLRRRLADMESAQRASGGTAAPDFWANDAGGAAGGDAGGARADGLGDGVGEGLGDGLGDGPGDGSRPAARMRSARPVAGADREPLRSGPWAQLPADVLSDVDPLELTWLTDEEMADPAWQPEPPIDPPLGHVEPTAVLIDAVTGMSLRRHDDHALESAGEWVAHQLCAHEVMLVNVLTELEERGQQPPGGLTRIDWLRAHAPGTSAGQAKAIVTLARAFAQSPPRSSDPTQPGDADTAAASDATAPSDATAASDATAPSDATAASDATAPSVTASAGEGGRPPWARLRAMVSMHLVTVANAAQIVSFHERVGRLADPEDLAAAFDDLFAQAPTTRPEELARIVRHHTEQVTPPRDEPGEGREERADEARRSSRGLWFAQPNASGMVRMHGVLDPEAAAIVKSAIDPLSAPRPIRDEGNRIVQADPRSPAKRRADALVEIISRGVSAAEGVPVTDQAKVVVLIDHDVLAGQVRGTGMSLSGDVLSPSTVRRLACDAAIIPIVLGAESEPLDLGRERRLVSKGLRLALIARDRGCSFPGCSVPPSWTQAHHVTHWVRGGRTSLLDCTLLCQRHHTYVHRHDLTATVTASGVTWQL